MSFPDWKVIAKTMFLGGAFVTYLKAEEEVVRWGVPLEPPSPLSLALMEVLYGTDIAHNK